MTRPITIEVKIPDTEFHYRSEDAEVIGAALAEAIRLYWGSDGESLHGVTVDFEEYELVEGSGLRLTLMGEGSDASTTAD